MGCPFYNRAMARPYDICIRGAGIVARTLALQLAAKRLRVALTAPLQPTSTSGHSDVRAYALSQPSRELLQSIRCWPDAEHATPVLGMEVMGDDNGKVQFSAVAQGVEALNWMVDVPALEAQLANAVRFQPLIEMVDAPQSATLTVVCEGRHSATRDEFGIEFDTLPYGQWALAARVQCATAHGQVARQWFSGGEITAMLPLDGPDGNLCALVWSVNPERATTLQHLDTSAFCQALETASRGALGSLTLASERQIWPLQQATARRWCGSAPLAAGHGAWVLAGDAAHNVHPLAGQGLNLGLGDVAELVRVLDGRAYWRSVGDMRLLRQYERARKADLQIVGNAGDALQRLFNHNHPALQSLRNWGMNGFERSGALKQWIAKRAMGMAGPASTSASNGNTTT
jgi:2-polyprenyl-6-methoxyphenol hydroxylase-like FAD-dependent oxidoreductase